MFSHLIQSAFFGPNQSLWYPTCWFGSSWAYCSFCTWRTTSTNCKRRPATHECSWASFSWRGTMSSGTTTRVVLTERSIFFMVTCLHLLASHGKELLHNSCPPKLLEYPVRWNRTGLFALYVREVPRGVVGRGYAGGACFRWVRQHEVAPDRPTGQVDLQAVFLCFLIVKWAWINHLLGYAKNSWNRACTLHYNVLLVVWIATWVCGSCWYCGGTCTCNPHNTGQRSGFALEKVFQRSGHSLARHEDNCDCRLNNYTISERGWKGCIEYWGLQVLSRVSSQVHNHYGNYESFGDGDMKEEGIKKFFESHKCNHWCRAMELKSVSHHEWIPPREVLKFPGISVAFLKELTDKTLKKVRSRYHLAEPWRRILEFWAIWHTRKPTDAYRKCKKLTWLL